MKTRSFSQLKALLLLVELDHIDERVSIETSLESPRVRVERRRSARHLRLLSQALEMTRSRNDSGGLLNETIEEQRAELEDFRYKLDALEVRLNNSSFMDPEERENLMQQAKEAREHFRVLERKLLHVHRKSRNSVFITFVIFTLFLTLYVFLMVKTIWNEKPAAIYESESLPGLD